MSCSTISRKAKTCNEIGMLPSVRNATEVVFPSGAGMQMFVGFPTLKHATYSSHVRSMDHSVVLQLAKHFPETTKQGEKVEEGI